MDRRQQRPITPRTTHTAEHLAMTSQEKWITSGASRLKARQNRGFIFRAKQKASSLATNVMDTTRQQAGGRSQGQQPKRRRIVGESQLQDTNESDDSSAFKWIFDVMHFDASWISEMG
jgi:hypothetical protein